MCNVSDRSFWLNLMINTVSPFCPPNPLHLATFDPWLQYCLKNPAKHHVNKIIIHRLEWTNILQFASGCCYKLRRPTIITKCCNPCYKMRSFHLLQNEATLITKFASYYKMPQLLIQNAQVITKCVVITKCRRENDFRSWQRYLKLQKTKYRRFSAYQERLGATI